ncbi:Gfo/Idh/MocA family oxidoreductase [Paremcibacter congregatus]|uniref:Gfo/Idh/MocA family protein n=1 Tax=Paremcibacter congregatus TaxID=2043170 RepID=UPI0030EE58F2|tara:strand:- start:3358 stop:4542 length:1185 start_codon:yes stop_codon:yes gene_type:complete
MTDNLSYLSGERPAAPLKMGMIGGGPGAFIGDVHRMAARLDGEITLVGGVFSRDEGKSRAQGAELHLDPARIYPDYNSLLKSEAALSPAERMDFISIVTPNHLHFPVAAAALSKGFAVLSDKPATLDLEEAILLQEIVEKTGGLYGLTQTYLGYPMVRQARYMVANGDLGKIRRITVDYPQGWLSRDLEKSGNRQAAWRTMPETSGISGCFSDIGTHAHSLVEYISGDQMHSVCAALNSVGAGRLLDDDGAVLFRMAGGAEGSLSASQVCAGADNGLMIRIYGEKASLSWLQQRPDQLLFTPQGAPQQVWVAGTDKAYLCAAARRSCRLPAGHPEGYIEAFANIYRDFAASLRGDILDEPPVGIKEGVRGMAFVAAVIANHQATEKWTEIKLCR